ncbi:hypothetical protein D9M71_490030 [compost metagenome]
MSTSGSTMAASLPPNSRVIRLRLRAPLSITRRPVAVEPVKVTLSMSGWEVIQGPKSSPPDTTLTTPGGSSSLISSPSLSEVSGVKGDGLSTTVLPATSAGASFQTASRTGKFHGTMAPTTPIGT